MDFNRRENFKSRTLFEKKRTIWTQSHAVSDMDVFIMMLWVPNEIYMVCFSTNFKHLYLAV
jgi:hypothetical protein